MMLSNFFGKKQQEAVGEFLVRIPLGISSREAAMLVRLANKTKSDITIAYSGEVADCKSIMALMMLAAGCGSTLKVVAKGNDAKEAVQQIGILLEQLAEEQIEKHRLEKEKAAKQVRDQLQSDERWLTNPSIPGFSPSDLPQKAPVDRILLWPGLDGFHEISEAMVSVISNLVGEMGLTVCYCPIPTTYVSRLQPNSYAVLITSLIGNQGFIQAIGEHDPKIQIVVCSRLDYRDFGKEAIEGLRIAAYIETPNADFVSCLRSAIQDVALPLWHSGTPSVEPTSFFPAELPRS